MGREGKYRVRQRVVTVRGRMISFVPQYIKSVARWRSVSKRAQLEEDRQE